MYRILGTSCPRILRTTVDVMSPSNSAARHGHDIEHAPFPTVASLESLESPADNLTVTEDIEIMLKLRMQD